MNKQAPTNVAEVFAPGYKANIATWRQNTDFVEGDAVAVKRYIRPLIDSEQIGRTGYLTASGRNLEQLNKVFRDRAVYLNVPGTTIDAMLGLAFMVQPATNINPQLESLTANANGEGMNLTQLAHDLVRDVLTNGRAGLLVDFPDYEAEELSRSDLEMFHPVLVPYSASQIHEWRTTKVGSTSFTSLVVLSTYKRADTLEGELTEARLELALDASGYYYQRTWMPIELNSNPNSNRGKITWSPGPVIYPTDASGNKLTKIPWVWIGSHSNSPNVDRAPLTDIVRVARAHLNSSALYQDSEAMVGQPQPVIVGLDTVQQEELEKSGLQLGSGSVLSLPIGGSFKFEQVAPNTMARESMEDKMAQMLALGARLIAPKGSVRTAYEVGSEDVQRNSVLSLICQNVSEAVTRALDYAGIFTPNSEGFENEYKISTKFAIATPDNQAILFITRAYAEGGVSIRDLFAWQKSNGLTTLEDFDEWREGLVPREVAGTSGGTTDEQERNVD